jgi:hypothetical protein
MSEPGIDKLLGPRWHWYGSYSCSLADQIDNDPVTLSRLQLIEVQAHHFRAP